MLCMVRASRVCVCVGVGANGCNASVLSTADGNDRASDVLAGIERQVPRGGGWALRRWSGKVARYARTCPVSDSTLRA